MTTVAIAGSRRRIGAQTIRDYALWAVLLLLLVIFTIANPNFLTPENLLNIARQVSLIGIAAVGMTFVMIAGGIDLSIGALLGLCSVLAAFAMVTFGWPIWAAVALALVVALASGSSVGWVVTRIGVPGLIVTLAYYTALRGISFTITQGQTISGMPESFAYLGQGYLLGIPVPVWIMAVAFIAGHLVLTRTTFGMRCYAVGGGKEAARLSGINVKRIEMSVYVISALLTGVAAMIMLSRLNSANANLGTGFELDVITAVILGGVSFAGGEGRIRGALVGVLILGVLSNGLVLMGVSPYFQAIVMGGVLLLAVSLDMIIRRGRKK
jgi:ribose transport system permease protein